MISNFLLLFFDPNFLCNQSAVFKSITSVYIGDSASLTKAWALIVEGLLVYFNFPY